MIGTPREYFRWGLNAAASRLGLKLFSINLEVTKRCNARCNICDYWKTTKEQPLFDYLPVVKYLDPISVVLTGGEPLLRKDIVKIVSRIKKGMPLIRISLITNGILLTKEMAVSLYNAGLDQLSISLDFPDDRHDSNRGVKGLFRHIAEVIPEIESKGMNLLLNTVIMKDNLDVVIDMANWAADYGIGISYSCYSHIKTSNKHHVIPQNEIKKLQKKIDELIRLKHQLVNITNSEYYLRKIPEFFKHGKIKNCQAGLRWLQVTPEGHIKRCSEMSVQCFWPEYNRHTFQATKCDRCWFACRGESQAPFQASRLKKYGHFIINKLRNG